MPIHFEPEFLFKKLSDAAVLRITHRTGGGNNVLWKVDTAEGTFAMKWYPPPVSLVSDVDKNRGQSTSPNGDLDRLGREFYALRFLHENGIKTVPKAVTADFSFGVGLFEWVEGEPVSSPDKTHLERLFNFLKQLKESQACSGASELGLATSAYLSFNDLLADLNRRIKTFSGVEVPALRHLLDDRIHPVMDGFLNKVNHEFTAWGGNVEQKILRAQQCLSPSDFGFHNILRKEDGQLVFLDFEYFGWDDPVKLLSDTLWRPSGSVPPLLTREFLSRFLILFEADGPISLSQRFKLYFPLIGIIWCLIILNPFVPAQWYRWQLAGRDSERNDVLQFRLVRARDILSKLENKEYCAQIMRNLPRDPGRMPRVT